MFHAGYLAGELGILNENEQLNQIDIGIIIEKTVKKESDDLHALRTNPAHPQPLEKRKSRPYFLSNQVERRLVHVSRFINHNDIRKAAAESSSLSPLLPSSPFLTPLEFSPFYRSNLYIWKKKPYLK